MKQNSTSEIDVDYNPDDTGDESEEDHQEVARSVGQVSKKVIRLSQMYLFSFIYTCYLIKIKFDIGTPCTIHSTNVNEKDC
ncbi:hypothetical protein Hanom_Chr06g00554291 [Helianthus anomalus]